ncbi:hypothetical protein [Rathayibacter iranicus]|uniref:Uncharacterized protein n=1 Tax=Rathayibacter iranicus TaxID=59737 RepID=A0AAD1EN95_9MICO|nr:hypothetical protein [Rathayibacter iranicus]AZZ56941.1 hypothetical protein C7V51_14420 [Rathayibacter iranicus]MWV29541.1 hypothetical protein [Rathayibacter iranicus NCPPB 2253 = VKM Ac-1602]PPI42300.1 hypothetical protein C5E09_13275 [Rathayibacter iranicus]PPI57605.1 hypothetical protein C5E08_14175 [Rathayibacter iranicus]PPI68720.1 hypothetical protein C5E01_13230 [Rathayibacter iranicus]
MGDDVADVRSEAAIAVGAHPKHDADIVRRRQVLTAGAVDIAPTTANYSLVSAVSVWSRRM